ncbi:MAG TPA: hypothetical protein VG013_32645, partial [Gemmataceae bacterium]|nr:hypothetical protein [Gemmataceae bacterium]
MKRCVIATAVLLGGTLATAHAEYLRITVNLGPRKNDGGGNGPGMGAIGGRMMGMPGQGQMKPGAGMMGMMG